MSTTEHQNGSGTGRRRRNRGGRNRYRGGNQNRGGGQGRRRNRDSRNRDQSQSKEEPKNFIGRFLAWLFPAGEESAPPKQNRRNRNDREKPRRERSESSEPKPRKQEERTPEAYEVVTPRLYVGNLPYEAVESDLFDLFHQHGQVKTVELVFGRSGKSKGFGFVEMEHLEAAKRAADSLNQTDFMGRQLIVSGAKVKA